MNLVIQIIFTFFTQIFVVFMLENLLITWHYSRNVFGLVEKWMNDRNILANAEYTKN